MGYKYICILIILLVGMFKRNLKNVPITKFPTVIADVVVDENGDYIGYVEYLCLDVKLVTYEELRF